MSGDIQQLADRLTNLAEAVDKDRGHDASLLTRTMREAAAGLVALAGEAERLREAASLCAYCTPEADHNGVLCRRCANALAGRYKTALEELVNTGTVLLLSSRQGQDEWDAFTDALLAARVLAGEGETP